MPGQFLTEAERSRLSNFPVEIAPDDLITHFTRSPSDRQHIQLHHRSATRLGVALQLCALRYLGFSPSPANLKAAPKDVVTTSPGNSP